MPESTLLQVNCIKEIQYMLNILVERQEQEALDTWLYSGDFLLFMG